MSDVVLYDLTEFVRHPLRTGIQRVTYEVVAHWAGPLPLAPVRISEDGLYLLPPKPWA
jgi:hypothetical protein